jgi:hypothetical protein
VSATVDLQTSGTERRRVEAGDRRLDRMAELVAGLTGCDPGGARHVLRDDEPHRHEDPLAVVARAMIAVEQPHPLREPVYLDVG